MVSGHDIVVSILGGANVNDSKNKTEYVFISAAVGPRAWFVPLYISNLPNPTTALLLPGSLRSKWLGPLRVRDSSLPGPFLRTYGW